MRYSRHLDASDNDTYVDTGQPYTNFGTLSGLVAGYYETGSKNPDSHWYYAAILIDLSSYIGSTVNSGRLFLKAATGTMNDASFYLERVNASWNELSLTANSFGGLTTGTIWQQVGPYNSATDLDFDNIAAAIQDALSNRGGILRLAVGWTGIQSDPNYCSFHSSDASVEANRPLLEFDYVPAPVQGIDNIGLSQSTSAKVAKPIYADLIRSAKTWDSSHNRVGISRAIMRELRGIVGTIGDSLNPAGTEGNPALGILVSSGIVNLVDGVLSRGNPIRLPQTPSNALVQVLVREAATVDDPPFTEEEIRRAARI